VLICSLIKTRTQPVCTFIAINSSHVDHRPMNTFKTGKR